MQMSFISAIYYITSWYYFLIFFPDNEIDNFYLCVVCIVYLQMREKIAAGDVPRGGAGGDADGSDSNLEEDMADVMMVIEGQEQTVITSRPTSPVVPGSTVASSDSMV